jgi:hypothetical protein
MSIEIVQVFAREDITKPWWHDSFPSGHLAYFQENFIDLGIYTGTRELLEDGLLLIIKHTFIDEEARQKFVTDPYLISCAPMRDAHNAANGITRLM